MSSLWETMKKEYVYGGMTYRELAERYGVPESTVGKHARADLWRELRRERRLQLPLCAEEGEAAPDSAPTRRDERSESADEGSVGENEEAGMRNEELRCGFAAYENADSLGDASFIPTAAVSDTASPRRDERSESADEGSVGENEEAGMRNEELRCGFAAYENADSLGDASFIPTAAVSDTAPTRRDERSESADPAQPRSSVIANRCSHRCGNPSSSYDTQEANERTGDADCHVASLPAMTETGDAAMREEVLRLAMRMAQLGCDAAQDKKQFMRYIVSEKSGKGETETAERVFRKLDTKAYRELTAAIKDLWSIAQGGEAERAGITVVLGSAEDSAV